MDIQFIGILLIIIGIIILISTGINGKGKVAVVGFIGPVPFGFGNNKNLVVSSLIIVLDSNAT